MEITVFGKHIAIARINPHGMKSKWSKFPADQIATLKALNMKGFKFEDSEGSGQSQELCVPPLSTPASPHSVHWQPATTAFTGASSAYFGVVLLRGASSDYFAVVVLRSA